MVKRTRSWGFIFMLALGCLCMVASGVLSRRVGGIEDVPSFQQNKEIQELANYAVNKYNKDNNAALCLSKVVKAQQQAVAAGTKFYLVLEALNDGKPGSYRAVIYVKPGQKYKELQEFSPVKY
uniref:Cysteine proteinase inhibitor n=1 Tax=Araucaria cunninghamii TaxID=56994 RepID=A0A0D6QTK5_ARACU